MKETQKTIIIQHTVEKARERERERESERVKKGIAHNKEKKKENG